MPDIPDKKYFVPYQQKRREEVYDRQGGNLLAQPQTVSPAYALAS